MNRPTKIGKYEVIDIIGRGGMGVVYKATDPHLDRLVAIKMMTVGYAEDPDILKRFYREAQSTGSLQHPNIVTVYDLGDHEGNPYLVMEYLEGESLDNIISSQRPLETLEKIRFVLEACHGLSYAHGRGIVHRDIKPANIMVLKNECVKLVDFGIAHIASNTLTRTGQIMGSVNYMSPEQINGKSVDARTDIFSIGVVLYQLFTHALPFQAESTAATLLKIIHEPPPPLSQFLPVYPKELEGVVFRALAKNREDRYASADEFALDLLQIHEQLKQESVANHLRQAESLIGKGELKQAKEHLQHLLRLDQKHTAAMKLLRQVQQQLDKDQSSSLARQLRTQAEERFAQQDFDAALQHLDQAVTIDASNVDLQKFRVEVVQAKAKADELQRILQRAEQAHQRGDLEDAKQAADEALEVDPDSTQAKAVYRIIHRDWIERSRQRQLDGLLESARRELAARNLTGALNILKQAEALDPQGAQVRALIEEVSAGREQERRRKEVDRLGREIEAALNRDDYESALAKIDEGLREFPQDRSLTQFKLVAEKQRAAAERKLFVRQQIAAARGLLDSGQTADALWLLQSAVAKTPHEPQLETLLTMVQELVARQREEEHRKELDKINREVEDALGRDDFDGAIASIENGLRQYPHDGSLAQLKAMAEKQRTSAERKRFVRQQIASARQLLDAGQAAQALAVLQDASQKIPQEPQIETLLGMVKERVAREKADQAKARSIMQAKEALDRQSYSGAVRILETAQVQFAHTPEIDNLLRLAREQQAQESARKTAEEATRRAQQWITDQQYDSAIQLLENTIRQLPGNDQLRVLLEETRRRREDYQKDLQAAIAKARQFLNEGAAARAVELLTAQPQSYSRSAEFAVLLEVARKQQVVEMVESQVAGEPDLAKQVQILEAAQKKYPAYTDWSQRLGTARDRRKSVAGLVDRARKFERAKKYREALQEWQRLQAIYQQYPGLAGEIERVARLEEEVRVRALATAQKRAVGQDQSVAVVTPPPVTPERPIDRTMDFAAFERGKTAGTPQTPLQRARIVTIPPSELENRARDVRVSWFANRKNIAIGACALVIIVAGALAFRLRSSREHAAPLPTEAMTALSQPSAGQGSVPDSSQPGAVASDQSPNGATATADTTSAATDKTESVSRQEKSSSSANQRKQPKAGSQNPAQTNSATAASQPGAETSNTVAVNQPPASQPAVSANQPVTPPATANQPAAPPSLLTPEKAGITAAIQRYKQAYETRNLDEVLKVWPSMSRGQKKTLKHAFETSDAVTVNLYCGDSTISGDAARIRCNQSVRYTRAGQPQPEETNPIDILLKKKKDEWLLNNIRAD